MTVYVVTWNINKAGASYNNARTKFLARVATYDNTAEPGLDTVRWISTVQTAQTLADNLNTVLDDDDKLFVTRVNRSEYWGWLSQATWDWIQART